MLRPLPFEGQITVHIVNVCFGKGSSLAEVLLELASATLRLGCALHVLQHASSSY